MESGDQVKIRIIGEPTSRPNPEKGNILELTPVKWVEKEEEEKEESEEDSE